MVAADASSPADSHLLMAAAACAPPAPALPKRADCAAVAVDLHPGWERETKRCRSGWWAGLGRASAPMG